MADHEAWRIDTSHTRISGEANAEAIEKLKQALNATANQAVTTKGAVDNFAAGMLEVSANIKPEDRKVKSKKNAAEQKEEAAAAAYRAYTSGVTNTAWEDATEGMRELWRKTVGYAIEKYMTGHSCDPSPEQIEQARLTRNDGKRVSRHNLDVSSMKATIWGEEIVDRDMPAKVLVGLDAAQRPVRLFLDNVEVSRQVSEIAVRNDHEMKTHVTLTFPVQSMDTMNINEMPHNPKLKMKVEN